MEHCKRIDISQDSVTGNRNIFRNTSEGTEYGVKRRHDLAASTYNKLEITYF